MAGSQKDRKMEAAKGYLATHPDATNAEVSIATGVSDRTVTSARAVLLAAGVLKPGMRGRPPEPAQTGPVEPPPAAPDEALLLVGIKDLAAIEAALPAPLTKEDRKRRYSAIAISPKIPVAAQIAALRALDATEEQEKVELGPPPPQTREERISRVSLMLEALYDFDGFQACQSAWDEGLLRHQLMKGPDAEAVQAPESNEPPDAL